MSLPLNQVVVGDCTEIMRGWPADSIDLIVTSPPYWGLRSYGPETVRVWGGSPECEHKWAETTEDAEGYTSKRRWQHGINREEDPEKWSREVRKYSWCQKCGAWRGSLGLEPHPQMFIDHLVEICREIKRVLKPTGTFWLNLGDTYSSGAISRQTGRHDTNDPTSTNFGGWGNWDGGILKVKLTKDKDPWLQPKQKLMLPSRVAIALQHDGWILRSDIIWHKPNAMPSSVKDRLTNAYEHVFLFAKQGRYYFDLDAIREPSQTTRWGKNPKYEGEGFQSGLETQGYHPKGKNPGNVWEAEEEKLTKHDIAVGRIGNFSYTDPLHTKDYHPKGKNPGDLWRISTKPFPGAHFATFPSALIEPIVKAGSPRWICSKCEKPRTRITETTFIHRGDKGHARRGLEEELKGNRKIGIISREKIGWNIHETTGWSDCGCGEKWIPGIVMDPFGGSGTVGQVAHRLGRRFILIELVPEYADMARQRVRGKYKPIPEGMTPLDHIFSDDDLFS